MMTPRDRVDAALHCREADRVSWCELGIDRALAAKLMGWGGSNSQAADLEANSYNVDEAKAVAGWLGTDNICCVLRAPVYAHKEPGQDGRLFYGEGRIQTRADLAKLQLPDPHSDALYAEAAAFIERKDDFSAWLVTRFGIFPTMLSMGLEHFSMALYDDRPFVEEILDRYCDWVVVVAERVCRMGFDVFVTTDDMAFKTGPFFSPDVFDEVVLPRYRKVAEAVTLPWILHSDGDVSLFVDRFIDFGITGLHPNENGAMDIRVLKQRVAGRLCLLGNVDLNLLGLGTPDEVDRTVRELIRDLGPGGGYICTSGNSLAGYLAPDNVMAMGEAIRKYGVYPIRIEEPVA